MWWITDPNQAQKYSTQTRNTPVSRLYSHFMERQTLLKKIEELPPDRLAEVENFVEAIIHRHESAQKSLHRALSEYATQHAGTTVDLDQELEAASV